MLVPGLLELTMLVGVQQELHLLQAYGVLIISGDSVVEADGADLFVLSGWSRYEYFYQLLPLMPP